MKANPSAILASALATVAFSVFLSGCSAGPGGMPSRNRDADAYASNGERIYFTGTSGSGDSIRYEGGPTSDMMMRDFACADCHGDDGTGGKVTMMMDTFVAPEITWPALSGEHDETGENEHQHQPYTEETVKLAITYGVNPAGESLDGRMPRWRMSDRDLDDLTGFLMSLGVDENHADD